MAALRMATGMLRWKEFPGNVKVKLGELCSAVGRSGSLEILQGWWAQNEESLGALGVTVDTQVDPDGWTALHYASFFGHEEIVRYLVDVCGADVNMNNVNDGRTALIIAARNNKPGCVRALLELGANPELRDDDEGKTALDKARDARSQECVHILEQWVPAPSVKSALKG